MEGLSIFHEWLSYETELPVDISEANILNFKKKSFVNQYSSSIWYESLKDDVLAEWESVELKIDEAKILIKVHGSQTGGDVTESDLTVLKSIIERLDDTIRNLGGVALVRLNNTSSNDLWSVGIKPLLIPGLPIKESYIDPIQESFARKLKSIAPDDDDSQVLALSQAFQEGIRVYSGYDALRNLLSSFVCISELLYSVEYPSFYKSSIVVRKYQKIDPRKQFRGFVYNKRLNAVTQLLHTSYFPGLESEVPAIRDAALDLFDRIGSKLSNNNFVFDFAISGKSAKVTDIKPWINDVGSLLFSWKEKVMVDGPLEVRVRNEPISGNNLHSMPVHWKKLTNVYRSSMGVPKIDDEQPLETISSSDSFLDVVRDNPIPFMVGAASTLIASTVIAVHLFRRSGRR